MEPINVFLADDHEVIRDGLKVLITRDPRFNVIAEASDGNGAIEGIERFQPDILLMDVSMPGINGIEAAAVIAEKYPLTKVIILSMHQDIDTISKCLESNVMGFIVKTEGGKEVIRALESVSQGKKYFSDAVTKAVIEKYATQHHVAKKSSAPAHAELTTREREIIQYIGQGWTNQKIADKLFISFRTVETHRANLMRKLDAKNSIELINNARRLGIID